MEGAGRTDGQTDRMPRAVGRTVGTLLNARSITVVGGAGGRAVIRRKEKRLGAVSDGDRGNNAEFVQLGRQLSFYID